MDNPARIFKDTNRIIDVVNMYMILLGWKKNLQANVSTADADSSLVYELSYIYLLNLIRFYIGDHGKDIDKET